MDVATHCGFTLSPKHAKSQPSMRLLARFKVQPYLSPKRFCCFTRQMSSYLCRLLTLSPFAGLFLGLLWGPLARPLWADPMLAPVDQLRSSIRVHLQAQAHAQASFLIQPTRWFIALRLDRKKLTASNFELAIAADTLEFAPDPTPNPNPSSSPSPVLSPSNSSSPEFSNFRATLLGPTGLHTKKFPMIRISGDSVTQKSENELLVRAKLTLHGVTRPIEIPVTWSPSENDTLKFKGTLKWLLSDFKVPLVQPGSIRLQNQVWVDFDLMTETETVIAFFATFRNQSAAPP